MLSHLLSDLAGVGEQNSTGLPNTFGTRSQLLLCFADHCRFHRSDRILHDSPFGGHAIADALRDKPANRLEAAQAALGDFEATGVELTGLCKKVKRALQMLNP